MWSVLVKGTQIYVSETQVKSTIADTGDQTLDKALPTWANQTEGNIYDIAIHWQVYVKFDKL